MSKLIKEPGILIIPLWIIGFAIATLSAPLQWVESYSIDSLVPVLIGIMVMTYMIIRLEAEVHKTKIVNGETIKHKRAWMLRVGIAICFILILHVHSLHIVKMFNLLVFTGCWWGIAFNWTLNQKRGKPILYAGVKGASSDESWIEELFQHNGTLILAAYILLGIAAAYVYIQH